MREIVFDTETTGLDPKVDRVIEIGGVELWNHIPTGRSWHRFVNPGGRKVEPDAFAVHGLSDAFLADKPAFAAIADDFTAFFAGARLIAHNAAFDVKFLDAELRRVGLPAIRPDLVVDTLPMARRKFPMAPATLDALCSRFSVDTTKRDKHGALVDSELLAAVYIELIGGRQAALGLDVEDDGGRNADGTYAPVRQRPVPLPSRLTDEDKQRHLAFVRTLGDAPAWLRHLEEPAREAAQAEG